MTENTEPLDPFAPQEGGLKTKFGKLKLIANPVTLESGASYTVKGIHDRDGNTREWRGKKLDKNSKRFHIIMHVRADDKDGNEYEMARDMLNSDKAYTKIVHPALTKVFGKELPTTNYALVKLEEVPTGESFIGRDGNTLEKTAWRVTQKYANEAALKAAEKEHFSRFTSAGNGATESANTAWSFNQDTIDAIKRNHKKGKTVEYIADTFAEEQIEKYGRETVTAEIEKLIA